MTCGTLIYLNENAWTMRFEMDDNTRDAITSIDYNAIHNTAQHIPETLNYETIDGRN